MKDLILDLRKKGKTVLMCSHRLDDVDVCDASRSFTTATS